MADKVDSSCGRANFQYDAEGKSRARSLCTLYTDTCQSLVTALTTLWVAPVAFLWQGRFGRGSLYDSGTKTAENGALCGIYILRSLLGRSGVVSRVTSGSLLGENRPKMAQRVILRQLILCVHKRKYSYVVETVTMYKAEWLIGHYCYDLSLWST